MAECSPSDKVQRFWNHYSNLLIRKGVKPQHVHWHQRRAQQFIKAHHGHRLASLTSQDIADYFTDLGKDASLAPWQFRQAVDAIQNLYNIVSTEWASQFDWNYWRDSAKALETQHASVAREFHPGTPQEFAERIGDTRFAPLIRRHHEVFNRLSAVMRTRGMSIRTEKAYMGWVCRFIWHFSERPPAELGAPEVAAFLEHLAVKRNVSASTQKQLKIARRGRHATGALLPRENSSSPSTPTLPPEHLRAPPPNTLLNQGFLNELSPVAEPLPLRACPVWWINGDRFSCPTVARDARGSGDG